MLRFIKWMAILFAFVAWWIISGKLFTVDFFLLNFAVFLITVVFWVWIAVQVHDDLKYTGAFRSLQNLIQNRNKGNNDDS